jgi:hypothetical protein
MITLGAVKGNNAISVDTGQVVPIISTRVLVKSNELLIKALVGDMMRQLFVLPCLAAALLLASPATQARVARIVIDNIDLLADGSG